MKILTLFFILITSVSALASLREIPSNLSMGVSDFQSKALGSACFTMDSVEDHLPCNASFLAQEMDPTFTAQVFLGNNISKLQDVDDLLSGHVSEQLVRDVFSNNNAIHVEGNLEASYRQKLWGFSFSPYRLTYYSIMRNSAYPVIDLHAMEEKSAKFQLASYVDHDFFAGAQFRLVDRKFIHREFTLFDALAEGGQSYFEPQYQKALYFEPGVHYEFVDTKWRPVVSAAIYNLGYVDHKYEGFENDPVLELGTAIKPEVALGIWEIGLNLELDNSDKKFHERLRAATSYELGMAQGTFSFDVNSYALGLLLKFKGVRGGIVYTDDKVIDVNGDSSYARTVYTQFGFEI